MVHFCAPGGWAKDLQENSSKKKRQVTSKHFPPFFANKSLEVEPKPAKKKKREQKRKKKKERKKMRINGRSPVADRRPKTDLVQHPPLHTPPPRSGSKPVQT